MEGMTPTMIGGNERGMRSKARPSIAWQAQAQSGGRQGAGQEQCHTPGRRAHVPPTPTMG
jgi:hypothetical protein